MSRYERSEAALAVATAVLEAAGKVALGPAGEIGASLTNLLSRQVKDKIEKRRAEKMIEECVNLIAERMMTFAEYEGISENDFLAAALGAREVIDLAGTDLTTLVRSDLDAAAVYKRLQPASTRVLRSAGLGAHAERAFEKLLHEASAYLVEAATALPDFTATTSRELLRRTTQLQNDLRQALIRLPATRGADSFTTDYLRTVVNKLDRMELFGLGLSAAVKRYPLSVAYLSLSIETSGRYRGISPASTSVRIEAALEGGKRHILIGEAGSGKTTLLRWLAVTCASRRLPAQLAAWNKCIPFILPLRQYDSARLPPPEEFLQPVGKSIAGEMPPQWVHKILREGRGLVLIDGFDELRDEAAREAALEWIRELTAQFPESRYVLTSRPNAMRKKPGLNGFATVELQPMSDRDLKVFVHRWHLAVGQDLEDDATVLNELQECERSLLAAIEADRHLRSLAVNPLLCGMLCALNRDTDNDLPKDRMAIYAAALKMLLGQRDKERGAEIPPPAAYEPLVTLLQALALWMLRQGLSQVDLERAAEVVGRTSLMVREDIDPDTCMEYLLARSGLLREPVQGHVDFVHRTFQEYLAAKAAIDNDESEFLLSKAGENSWHEVIVMAVGHAQLHQRDRLLGALVAKIGEDPQDGLKLKLLAVSCLPTSPVLDTEIKSQIEAIARDLIPPSSEAVAASLVAVGDLAVGVLNDRRPKNVNEARWSIVLLSQVRGDDALRLIGDIASGQQQGIGDAVVKAWRLFDRADYATRVIERTRIEELLIGDEEILPYAASLVTLRTVTLDFPGKMDLTFLGDRPPSLASLRVVRSPRSSLEGILRWAGVTTISVDIYNTTIDLMPLSGMQDLREVRLNVLRPAGRPTFRLSPLAALPNLDTIRVSTSNGSATVDLAGFEDATDVSIYVDRSTIVQNQALGLGCQVFVA